MKRLWALSIVAASAALGCPAWSMAQAPEAAPKKYREAPEFPLPAEWKKIKPSLMNEGTADEAGKKVFTDYYTFAVCELTRWKNREKFDVIRTSIIKELNSYGRAKETTLHELLVGKLSLDLPKIFNNAEYYPTARVNCLLLYGALNTKEGDIAGKGAEPLAAARAVLMGIVNDPRQPDYLRATALSGIMRHAENGPAADVRRDLTPSVVKLLAGQPDKKANKGVHNFFRRRAAEILRAIATRGYDAGLAQSVEPLAILAADEEARLEERCEAIRTLGYLDKRNYDEKRVGEIARTFTAFAAEVARQTPAPAAEEAEEEVPGDGAPPAANVKPAAATAAKPPEEKPEAKSQPVLSPDNQVYFLKCADVGLNGPAADISKGRPLGLATAAADDASKKLVTGLSTKLVEMGKIIVRRKDKSGPLNDDEIAKLHTAAEELEALLDAGAAVGAGGGAEQARARVP